MRWSIDYLQELLEETPYLQSLMGIGLVLSKYNIANECVRFLDKSELEADLCPNIIIYDNSFAIVYDCNHDSVRLYSESIGETTIDKSEFLKKWNGVALLIQPDSKSSEPDYDNRKRHSGLSSFKQYALSIGMTALFCVGAIINPNHFQWTWWAIICLNVMGLYVAFMLLQKQLHIPNKFADKLCGIAKESHCETVTNSDGGELFGLVKLSEVGSAFFFVNLVTLIFSPQSLYLLAIVAACVLPFSFWSIWYQKFKAKSWCVLCLITLAIMWLQASVYLIGGIYKLYDINWLTIIELLAGYVVAVLSINKIMDLFEIKSKARMWHREYNRLKVNDKVINAFELGAATFNTEKETCSSLFFGNPDAPTQITVFSNPYCFPCAIMHERIKDLPGNAVRVNYVMSYFPSKGSSINHYIIAAYQQLGPEKTWDLMTRWYESDKTIGDKFFKDLGLDITSKDVISEFEKHEKWKQNDRLYGTPTVIVNGREIVYPYVVEDYMYIPSA